MDFEVASNNNSNNIVASSAASEESKFEELIENTPSIGNVDSNNINANAVPKGEALLVCGTVGGDNVSLQDSFKRFLNQKKKERQIQKMCRDNAMEGGKRSEAYKESLRYKFIEQAKKYIGVPYAERYKAPDAPIAPLYLDCCGLVRQVVKDLQEDFGFIIGRWNQCYQMDTLPIVLDEKSLKPGDLIFYEGIFNSNRSKPQKHNNVHVEIFLGGETGEGTIGSRYQRGSVSIFPSYKFKSTTWDLVQYHFRSIDTWLDGVCKSCCPEHRWESDLLAIEAAAGKRSIFHDGHDEDADGDSAGSDRRDDQEDDDINAGGGEEGDGNGEESVETHVVVSSSDTPVVTTQLDGATVEQNTSNTTVVSETAIESNSFGNPIPTNIDESSASSAKSTKPAGGPGKRRTGARSQSFDESVPVAASSIKAAAGSPTRALKPAGGGVGRSRSVPVPVSPTKSTSARLPTKLAGEASEIDGDQEEVPAPRGSDSPMRSGKAVSTRNSSVAGAAGAASGRVRGMSSSLDSLSKSSKTDFPLTYYVAKANGWQLVKAALDKRGWQQLPFEYNFSTRFGLKWVERRSQIDYKTHTPGQLVCHIANNEVICSKVGLLQTMREHFCKTLPASSGSAASVNARKSIPWLPDTYLLGQPGDIEAMIAVEDALVAERGSGCIWIYKPACNNRGRGIQVFRGKETLQEICYGVETGDPETAIPPRRGLVQRYLEDPLLVGTDGFKFDVRCYLLIARNAPSVMAFYHPGYCRLTLKPYNASADLLDDPTIHLTNAAIQKKDPLYQENKESQIRTVEAVAAEIEATGKIDSANYLRNQLDHDIKCCMVDVLKAANPKFLRKHGYFDLLGCDFMVTASNKLVLLEINTNPAMSLDNSTLEALLPNVIDGTLQLVLDLQGPGRVPPNNSSSVSVQRDAAVLANLPYQFQLIMDEHAGYMYSDKEKH